MRAKLNGNTYGIWTAEEGTEVEVLEPSPNERALLVLMPEDAKLVAKRGKKCWLPAPWLDLEQEEPRICPTCGQVMP